VSHYNILIHYNIVRSLLYHFETYSRVRRSVCGMVGFSGLCIGVLTSSVYTHGIRQYYIIYLLLWRARRRYNSSWYKTRDQTHDHLTRLTIKRRHVQQQRSDRRAHVAPLQRTYVKKKKRDIRYNHTDAYNIIMCLCLCRFSVYTETSDERRWNQVLYVYSIIIYALSTKYI